MWAAFEALVSKGQGSREENREVIFSAQKEIKGMTLAWKAWVWGEHHAHRNLPRASPSGGSSTQGSSINCSSMACCARLRRRKLSQLSTRERRWHLEATVCQKLCKNNGGDSIVTMSSHSGKEGKQISSNRDY